MSDHSIKTSNNNINNMLIYKCAYIHLPLDGILQILIYLIWAFWVRQRTTFQDGIEDGEIKSKPFLLF